MACIVKLLVEIWRAKQYYGNRIGRMREIVDLDLDYFGIKGVGAGYSEVPVGCIVLDADGRALRQEDRNGYLKALAELTDGVG